MPFLPLKTIYHPYKTAFFMRQSWRIKKYPYLWKTLIAKPRRMKRLKYILTTILITCCAALFTACSDDDYSPIILIGATDESPAINEESNTLTLTPFSEGASYLIRGGDDGRYRIDNANEETVRCDYNGETLTFVPQSRGEARITISDRSGNSYELTIFVEYPSYLLKVMEIKASVEAPLMTQEDAQTLETEIIGESPVSKDCLYIFTYEDKDGTKGNVTISPYGNEDSKTAVFSSEIKYTEDKGTPYVEYTITFARNETKVLKMMPYADYSRESDIEPMALIEDVTDKYTSSYPQLEKAELIQTLLAQY